MTDFRENLINDLKDKYQAIDYLIIAAKDPDEFAFYQFVKLVAEAWLTPDHEQAYQQYLEAARAEQRKKERKAAVEEMKQLRKGNYATQEEIKAWKEEGRP